jgi:hypothetical protein
MGGWMPRAGKISSSSISRVGKNFKIEHETNVKLETQFFDVSNQANSGNDYGISVTEFTSDKPTASEGMTRFDDYRPARQIEFARVIRF